MKHAVAAALVVTLLASAARSASFDCVQASTDIEHKICGDNELSALDSTLGDLYARAVARADDVDGLRAAQRAWLREVRDACLESSCLKAAYRQRIAELMQVAWMTNARSRRICETVVEAVNDGSIEDSFERFSAASREQQETWKVAHPDRPGHYLLDVLEIDYDGDDEIETLGRVAQRGTCPSLRVSDIHRPQRVIYPPGNEGRFRWAYLGTKPHFLFVVGEPLLLSGRFSDVAQAGLLTWFAPDVTLRPLCFLGAIPETKARTDSADNPALCKAVAEGSVQFIPWSVPLTVPGGEMKKIRARAHGPLDGGFGRAEEYSLTGAELDVDLDGEKELFAPYSYSSGAGCGRRYQWLLEIDPETASIVDPPRKGVSYGHINNLLGGKASMGKSPPAFFEFEGKPYLLGSRSVVSLWGGELRRWCEYTPLRQHEIVEFYPVETWPESPFKEVP